MPSLLDLRRRIRAVKSTQQITKAMKMISASKLRRAQDRVVGARPFALQMQRVLNSLASRVDPSSHPLLAERESEADAKVLLIVVTADKGLCGGFNTNIIKAASGFILSATGSAGASGALPGGGRPGLSKVAMGLVGRKGRDFFKRRGFEIRMEEIGIFQRVKYADAKRIAEAAIEEFTSGRVSKVFIVYNEFKSVMQQRVVTEQLLPIPKAAVRQCRPQVRLKRRLPYRATLTTSTNQARRRFSGSCCRSTSRYRCTGRCSSRRPPSTPRA